MHRGSIPWLVAGAGFVLAACGGGGSRRPTDPNLAPTTSAQAGLPPGTVLGVSSAETGQAIQGASLVVGGRTYVSDATGAVALEEGVVPGSPLDVRSAGSLDRDTLLRSASLAHFSLWPRSSPTGVDEGYTRLLVYTWDDDSTPGSSPLYRPGGTQVALVPSAELQADPEAMAAHHRAADAVNAASGGGVRYVVASSAPPGAIGVATSLDAKDEGCEDRVLAFTSIRLRNGEISSARIVFCEVAATRDGTVTHEAGHTFGMGHSPDSSEVMHAFKLRRQAEDFGARESLVMRLMLQRRGGNRFPDNDRTVTTAASGEVKIVCH